jgi:leucyl aminopeptidase
MEKMGMRAALAVARGSVNPPMGVHLTYHPKKKAKKVIAIVGKAVTFDSGGLSIKPADGMMTMNLDMAGAASVIGLFQALPLIAPNVEVHGIFLAVENMPSGSAYRPGDVVKAMNGVAIEVLNTDAEGRVTLADALTYAERLKPDAIIDLATLTGACVVALGEDIAGYMGNDRKLLDRLAGAAKEAGEEMWELPLYQPYKELIKSKIGDIKNIGGGKWGGALTAGLFLSYFVNQTPWVHIDIAGPSYAEKETRPDLPYGGTGFGVRTLVRYLQGLS